MLFNYFHTHLFQGWVQFTFQFNSSQLIQFNSIQFRWIELNWASEKNDLNWIELAPQNFKNELNWIENWSFRSIQFCVELNWIEVSPDGFGVAKPVKFDVQLARNPSNRKYSSPTPIFMHKKGIPNLFKELYWDFLLWNGVKWNHICWVEQIDLRQRHKLMWQPNKMTPILKMNWIELEFLVNWIELALPKFGGELNWIGTPKIWWWIELNWFPFKMNWIELPFQHLDPALAYTPMAYSGIHAKTRRFSCMPWT